jgi:predicted DNA-binding mobile mystery protein A
VRARRFTPQDTDLCERLDETILGFRSPRRAVTEDGKRGWLRAIRRATGIPVNVLAKRLGVKKFEIFRLERSERTSRIVLANLNRAAEALGCELVYALVQQVGSLAEIADEETATRHAAQAMVRAKKQEKVEQIEEWIDLEGATRRQLRKELRRRGLRVR